MSTHNDRGFVMAIVLFGLVALSIAGATSVMLSSSDMSIVANERRRHQVAACAESGVEAAMAALPDVSWAASPPARPSDPSATPGSYAKGLYYSGGGLVARAEHYQATGPSGETYSSGNAAAALPANALVTTNSGTNITNMAGGGVNSGGTGAAALLGSGSYRLVSTCKSANGTVASEVETVIQYGLQR